MLCVLSSWLINEAFPIEMIIQGDVELRIETWNVSKDTNQSKHLKPKATYGTSPQRENNIFWFSDIDTKLNCKKYKRANFF